MKTYGLDYFKGQSQAFKNVTGFGQEINGTHFSVDQSPLFAYDAHSIIELPSPETLDSKIAVHAIGIDKDFAYALCNHYRRTLLDRTKMNDPQYLAMFDDMEYEDIEVIRHGITVARALLEEDGSFFQFDGGISIVGIRTAQIAMGNAFRKLTTHDISDHLSGDHKVYVTTLGSYIDTFDGFDSFNCINMVPAATPRIVRGDYVLGKNGESLGFNSEYALIIPVSTDELSN